MQLPTGKKTTEALEALKARGVSPFLSAISSGRTEAVDLVYRLVVNTFGDKDDTVC